MKRILFLLLALGLIAGKCYGGTISFDQLGTGATLTAAKYNDDLNIIYSAFNGSVEGGASANIALDTVYEVNMADDANPRISRYEMLGDFVYTGLLGSTSANLTTSITAGTAYPMGYRVVLPSATAHTYTDNMWTWVDLDSDGNFHYTETAVGAVEPAVYSNSLRITRVSTDAGAILTVVDQATRSFDFNEYDYTYDDEGEANLEDLLQASDHGFKQGVEVNYGTTSQATITKGSAEIAGEYRFVAANLPVAAANIDVGGAFLVSTPYYIYLVADTSSVKAFTVTVSSNDTQPSGATKYELVGALQIDSSGNIHSTTDYLRNEATTGWMAATVNTYYAKTHNLNSKNIDTVLWLSKSADGTNPVVVTAFSSGNNGIYDYQMEPYDDDIARLSTPITYLADNLINSYYGGVYWSHVTSGYVKTSFRLRR